MAVSSAADYCDICGVRLLPEETEACDVCFDEAREFNPDATQGTIYYDFESINEGRSGP